MTKEHRHVSRMTDAPLVRTIIENIEKEAARRAKTARSAYQTEMKALNTHHRAEQKQIEFREKEGLKAAERWRISAIAAVQPDAPVTLSDVRSVKREIGEGPDRRSVSLPRVAFLERGKGAA